MGTEEIFNFIQVNKRLSTGGQPTEDQLRAAAAEGFSVVINLATEKSENHMPDEAGLVQSLGMKYHHIPVEWGNPTLADFQAFDALLNQLGDAKVLVHCAANFRVTAFYGLYAQKRLGWTETQAEEFRKPIWGSFEDLTWEQFIQETRRVIQGGGNQQP